MQRSFDPMLSVYPLSDAGLAAEAGWGATVFAPDPILSPEKPSAGPAAASNSAKGQQFFRRQGPRESMKRVYDVSPLVTVAALATDSMAMAATAAP
ncbi:MAG TPA: hypothetical protein VMM54_08375 [Nitrospirota bacterium]|nr:hypothetical protein [Nitrospirota bacterium]